MILPVFILIFWIFASSNGIIPAYIFPSPKNLFRVFVDFISGSSKLTPYSGTFVSNFSVSCMRVFIGFIIASIFGLILGFLTGRSLVIKRIIDPTTNLIRTIPGIGWLPIAMIWFGVGEKTTIFLIALAAFFPIYINTAHGASQVSPLLIRAAKMLGANKITLFKTVIFPSAFPFILVGLRLGLGIAWAYLVLGELTGVSKGLGAIMMDSRMLGQVEMILVAMISIAILGRISDYLLVKILKIIFPYQEKKINE